MSDKSVDIAAAILAGGKGKRLGGRVKAFIPVAGTPVIQKTITLLKSIFSEIILVTNQSQDFKFYGKDALLTEDIIKDAGPLGGIHAALTRTTKPAVFFVACDMPFLHNDIILRLVNFFNESSPDCAVPRIGSHVEPLCALYRKSLKEKVACYLKNNSDYSVRAFLKTVETRYLDLEDNCSSRAVFTNLNTPEDLNDISSLS